MCVCETAPAHVTKGLYVTVCDYICLVFVSICLRAADIANVGSCEGLCTYFCLCFLSINGSACTTQYVVCVCVCVCRADNPNRKCAVALVTSDELLTVLNPVTLFSSV